METDKDPVEELVSRSERTSSRVTRGAQERGQLRSEDVRHRVRGTMRLIEEEMAKNDGVYPLNNGALSSAEVARRAAVHPTTLFSPKQRELGVEVKQWLEGMKARAVIGRGPVRRELATRVADWRRLYDGLAQSHRDTELELQQTQAQLSLVREELDSLQRENAYFKVLFSAELWQRVVPLSGDKS